MLSVDTELPTETMFPYPPTLLFPAILLPTDNTSMRGSPDVIVVIPNVNVFGVAVKAFSSSVCMYPLLSSRGGLPKYAMPLVAVKFAL